METTAGVRTLAPMSLTSCGMSQLVLTFPLFSSLFRHTALSASSAAATT